MLATIPPRMRTSLQLFLAITACSVKGEGVRITGLRIHGPDSSIQNDDPIHCDGQSSAIRISSDGPERWKTEIDNNELSAWPAVSVLIQGAQGVRVHHNVIQFNRRREDHDTCGPHNYGLGYGVEVDFGSAAIEANVFDHNRNDIASSGLPGAHYTATYNLVLDGAVEQSFDVHGGKDRADCTNIAGTAFVIHHNTFLQSHKPAVEMRGIPMTVASMYKNETRDGDESHAFKQINSHGNFQVEDNATSINRFPSWSVSFGGSSFWQWQQFEGTAMSDLAVGDFDGDGAEGVICATAAGWQWSKSAREGWAFLNTLTQPISQLRFGHFVGLVFTDVIRATGNEWQVSEGGTKPWRSLYTTTAPLSSAVFGDFEGDDHTDAFFADGTQWSIVELLAARDSTLHPGIQIDRAAIREFCRGLESGRVALDGHRVARLGSRVANVESPQRLVDSAVAAHVCRFRRRRFHRHRAQRERSVARVVGRKERVGGA
jgi:hypothetical protein